MSSAGDTDTVVVQSWCLFGAGEVGREKSNPVVTHAGSTVLITSCSETTFLFLSQRKVFYLSKD